MFRAARAEPVALPRAALRDLGTPQWAQSSQPGEVTPCELLRLRCWWRER